MDLTVGSQSTTVDLRSAGDESTTMDLSSSDQSTTIDLSVKKMNPSSVTVPWNNRIFSGCLVRGLPIGIPFETQFYIPGERKDENLPKNLDVFIILPIKKSSETLLKSIVNIESDDYPRDASQECQNIQEWEKKALLNKSCFIPADENYWMMMSEEQSIGHNSETPSKDENLDSHEVGEFPEGSDGIKLEESEYLGAAKKKAQCRRKRKLKSYDEDWNCQKYPKVKVSLPTDDDNETHESRRSGRLRSVGFRPDYRAIEAENETSDSEATFEDKILVIKTEINSLSEGESCSDTDEMLFENENYALNSDMSEEDIKPELDKLNEKIEKIHTALKRQDKQDPDFDPNEFEEDIDVGTNEFLDDSDEEKEEKVHVKGKRHYTRKCSKNEVKKKSGKKGKPSVSKKVKTKLPKKNKPTKSCLKGGKTTVQSPVDESEDIKHIAEMLKQKELEKKLNRIKVKLEDYPDKYRVDVMESFARKDRGKAKEESKTEVFLCTVCEKFRSKNADVMENHIEGHVNGELHCEQCDFIAAFVGELKRHKRLEHKRNITICSKCGAELSGTEGLKDHMGKVHDTPLYDCKLCFEQNGEKFACITKTKFRQHLRKEHSDKMFPCESCKRLFAHGGHLKKHLALGCPGNSSKAYPCEICGKTYSTFQHVNSHIERVHNKVRRFQCEHCPFAAAGAAGLAQHLHTHTGYHPFKCDQCTFTCVQRYQLTSHMRTHTGEKPYKCSMCNYAAAWNVQLKDHVKVHSLPDTVSCDECSIVFKDTRGLKNHQSKDHMQGTACHDFKPSMFKST